MDPQAKTPRKRVANFTADEKAVLAQLVKKRPILESKCTDGTSVIKKQAAWDIVTQEFNCQANVHKRETITLKRAWDNMKAFTRKARATERGNLIRTGGGPHAPPPPPQHGAIISMVEEAAPLMICEIKNAFDSDGAILDAIKNSQKIDLLLENNNKPTAITSVNTIDFLDTDQIDYSEENTISEVHVNDESNSPKYEDTKSFTDLSSKKKYSAIKTTELVRRPTDYIRREAVMRIKHLENKKKIEMQILKTQLEVEQIKKKAALLEEEKNKTLLEKAILELEELKKNIEKQNIDSQI